MEQMTTNSLGGKQHKVKERCQALFPWAILAVARLRAEGHDKHGYDDNNYLCIPVDDHVGRALRHILLWMAGDEEDGNRDEHLVHACCRIMMALEEIADEGSILDDEMEKQLMREFDEDEKREAEMAFLRKENGWDDYYDDDGARKGEPV